MDIDSPAKEAELQRMKLLATTLFWIFTAIFITVSLYGGNALWIGFVKATSEAAMVGAIADWFAVTALFRHPLGLKIPHTAIVPNRKDSIGQALGHFVKSNFLSVEVIADKLRSLKISHQIAGWLSRPENSHHLAGYVAIGLGAMVQVMKDEDIQDLIQQSITHQVRNTQIAPLLGNLLSLLTAGNRRRELVQGMIKLVADLLEENREALQERISEETPWWLPKNIDRAIYQKILEATDRTLQEVRRNPDHALHDKFEGLLNSFIDDLKHSPDVLEREAGIKEELLQDPQVQDFSSSLWVDLKAALINYSTNPNADAQQPIQAALTRLGQALLRDEGMLAKVDGWVEEAALYIVTNYGHEAEQLIAQTIRNWDAEETSRKIELHVGRDLQFIRINGTLVGGLVGFFIHAVSLLF